jgi:hypothetical protein
LRRRFLLPACYSRQQPLRIPEPLSVFPIRFFCSPFSFSFLKRRRKAGGRSPQYSQKNLSAPTAHYIFPILKKLRIKKQQSPRAMDGTERRKIWGKIISSQFS